MKILTRISLVLQQHWFDGVLGASLVLGFSTNLYALDIDYSLMGKPAPAFELPAVYEKEDGKVIKLSDYKGKLVLLNFWASWCGPCRAEIPTLTKLQDTYKNISFTVVGLAMESQKDAKAFLQGKDINFPNAFSADESGENSVKEILTNFGNPDGILPFSVLISPSQNILSIYPGIISETKMNRVLGRFLDSF